MRWALRHLRDRDKPALFRQQLLELAREEVAIMLGRHPLEHSAMRLLRNCQGRDCSRIARMIRSDCLCSADPATSRELDRLRGVVKMISSVRQALTC